MLYYTTWKTQQVTLLRIAANSYGQTKLWENPWWKVSWRILGRHVISPQQETQNNIQQPPSKTDTQDWPFACFNHSPPTMASLFRTNHGIFSGYQRFFWIPMWPCWFFLEHPIQQLPLPVKLGGSSDIEVSWCFGGGNLLFVPLQTALKSHLS